jgi:hypothetical protein
MSYQPTRPDLTPTSGAIVSKRRIVSERAVALLGAALLAAGTAAAQPPAMAGAAPTVDKFVPPGYRVLLRATADFNGDGLRDVLLVLARKGDADADRPLLILFRDPAGGYTLSIRADRAIPETAAGGAAANDGFDGVKVRGNTFVISRYGGSSVRHSDEWQFRFQEGEWVLIGEALTAAGPGVVCPGALDNQDLICTGYKIDTNFLTRRQVVTADYADVARDKDASRVVRRTLPAGRLVRLAEFEPRRWAPMPR